MPSRDDPSSLLVSRLRGLLTLVALIAALGTTFFAGFEMASEWTYFAQHTAQKSHLLRLPDRIADTDRALRQEQAELIRIQAEITRRLAGK